MASRCSEAPLDHTATDVEPASLPATQGATQTWAAADLSVRPPEALKPQALRCQAPCHPSCLISRDSRVSLQSASSNMGQPWPCSLLCEACGGSSHCCTQADCADVDTGAALMPSAPNPPLQGLAGPHATLPSHTSQKTATYWVPPQGVDTAS